MFHKVLLVALSALALSVADTAFADDDAVPLKMTPGMWELHQVGRMLSPVPAEMVNMTDTNCVAEAGFDPIAVAGIEEQGCTLTSMSSTPEVFEYTATCINEDTKAQGWGKFTSTGEQIKGELFLKVTDPAIARIEQQTELTLTRKGDCS